MEHVTPIDQPLAFLISFYSGYEGAGKAIVSSPDLVRGLGTRLVKPSVFVSR